MEAIISEVTEFFAQPNAYRSVLILVACIIGAYILSKFLADIIIKIAQTVAVRSDIESNEDRFIKLRQVETYLSVAVAAVRAAVVAVAAYAAWMLLSPSANSGVAAIGAGTVFIVVAGQTLGSLLRDITTGSMMIIEQWFHVGDFVKLEPFMDVSGVVERLTLRSTKIRSLNGEVVWVHNQHIQAAHVTPRGIRTMAVDVFARQKTRGVQTIKELASTMPVGPMMLAQPLHVHSAEKWGNGLWRITVTGQTAPGREWLIQDFFVNAIKSVDAKIEDPAKRLYVYEPIARYADPIADKKFKRAVRARKS